MVDRLVICTNQRLTVNSPSCGASNKALAEQMEILILERQIPVTIEYRKCLGQCDKGPNIRLAPSGKFFHNVGKNDLPMIINEIKQFVES